MEMTPSQKMKIIHILRGVFLLVILSQIPVLSHGLNTPDPWEINEESKFLSSDPLEFWKDAKASDAVLFWNEIALEVIRLERQFPPQASRLLAIQHLAMYDALASTTDSIEPYYGLVPAPPTPLLEVMISGAAHEVLISFFPGQANGLNAHLDFFLDQWDGVSEVDENLEAGRLAAQQLLQHRADDGANATSSYQHTFDIGRWRPTRPNFRPALAPQWGDVRPFILAEIDPYLLPAPPELTSVLYAQELLEVATIGEYFSSTRTPEETLIAQFWAYQSGTATPPGAWNRIASTVSQIEDLELTENIVLFALLNLALADSVIACWKAKFDYDFWRPITAIVLAGEDGNPDTVPISGWTPFIVTPPFPDYPSGHSMMSGTASVIMTRWFGEKYSFSLGSDNFPSQFGIPDVTRNFDSFYHAADEASKSRIYGGIHYRFACVEGVIAGEKIGKQSWKIFFNEPNETNLWFLF